MLLLTTTSDVLLIVTDSAATVDVHASWLDVDGTTVTPGSTNTAISSGATTTVVAAPTGTAKRNVKLLSVRNRHASTSVTATVQLYNGSVAYELDKRVLGPGQSIVIQDGVSVAPPSGGTPIRPWYGYIAGACVPDGHPGEQLLHVQRAGNIAATPTAITASVARCSLFMLPFDLTVNRLRAYGVGATTSIFRVALYRLSDLARITAELPFTTVANTWVSIGSALNVALTKDTPYFVAVSVNTTGTTAGPVSIGTTIAATTGQIITTPSAHPGNLAAPGTSKIDQYYFQFAVTTGALPATAPTLAAQAVWTGGMPAFWLDNSDT
jgi:hypothetical protein